MAKLIPIILIIAIFSQACKKECKIPVVTEKGFKGNDAFGGYCEDVKMNQVVEYTFGYAHQVDEEEVEFTWLVPEDAQVVKGQGTAFVKVRYGKKSGDICVYAHNKCGQSETICKQVVVHDHNAIVDGPAFPRAPTLDVYGFTIKDKGYLLWPGNTAEIWEFDPRTESWTQKSPYPSGTAATWFVIADKGYVVEKDNTLLEYDPVGDTWRKKTSFPGTTEPDVSFTINNKAYVGGGETLPNTAISDTRMWEYDPATDLWKKRADMPHKGIWPATFSIQNRGFLAFDKVYNNMGQLVERDEVYEYIPDVDIWLKLNNCNNCSNVTLGFSWQNTAFILHRPSTSGFVYAMEYNQAMDSWSDLTASGACTLYSITGASQIVFAFENVDNDNDFAYIISPGTDYYNQPMINSYKWIRARK